MANKKDSLAIMQDGTVVKMLRTSKEKSHIIVMNQGQPRGYVKSISYTNGTFKMCQYKQNAKGYTTLDKIQGDIDFLTKHYFEKGYIFLYD